MVDAIFCAAGILVTVLSFLAARATLPTEQIEESLEQSVEVIEKAKDFVRDFVR